jgi:microcystin-dependent protein
MSVDGTIGEIRIFGGFIPKGWLPCDGRMLDVTGNTALFSVIGTYFGGNGVDTFALPNLQGVAVIGVGAGTSGPAVGVGDKVGAAQVTLTTAQVPSHNHALSRKGATSASQKTNAAGTNSNLAQISHLYGAGQHELVPHLLQNSAPNTTLNPMSLSSGVGGGQPHDNMQPYQALNFGICMYGVFPTRT